MNEKSNRKHFETEDDLKRENAAASAIQKASREPIFFEKLSPAVWVVDWAIYCSNTGALKHFAEYRRRFIPFGKYNDLRFCLAKWLKLRDLSMLIGRPSLFIFEFNDGIYYLKINGSDKIPDTCSFGRTDKRDNYDHGPCVVIEWSRLLPITSCDGPANEMP